MNRIIPGLTSAALLLSALALPPAPARSSDARSGPELAPDPPRPAPDPPVGPASPRPDPPVIQRLRERGLKVTDGGTLGNELRFWLIHPKPPSTKPTLLLTTPQGLLIQGKAYSPDGSILIDTEATKLFLNEPAQQRDGYRPLVGPPLPKREEPPATPAAGASLWDQLGHATTLDEGAPGAPLLYVFFDPFCAHCHQQWELLRAPVSRGQFQVRWVPVAVLGASQGNLRVVQGLLRQPQPGALETWMRHRRVEPDDAEATKVALGRNMALFMAFQQSVVPVLVYKDRTGRLVTKSGVTTF